MSAPPDLDISRHTDEQLVILFWWSDCLTKDEYAALRAELRKRGIDGWTGRKNDPPPPRIF